MKEANLFSAEWWNLLATQSVTWLGTHGIRIVVILVLLFIGLRLCRGAVTRGVMLAVRPRGNDPLLDLMATKRQTTLIKLLQGVCTIGLTVLAAAMVFQEIGFSIGPILASAGIIGAAIAFGSQSLVKDIITGAFVILEQQYSVGDVIRAGNLSGGVEEINLRTVVLRDADGSVHVIPHGVIDRVTVLTRDWSRLVLDIGVAYEADIDKASAVIKAALEEYAVKHADVILEAPELLGVQDLADSSVIIRAWIKMLPGKQWAAGRDLRASIKKALDTAGIGIPYPQRTIWLQTSESSSQ